MTPSFEVVGSGCFKQQFCEFEILRSFTRLVEAQMRCFVGLSEFVWGFFGDSLTGCLQIGTFGRAIGQPWLYFWQLFARGWLESGALMKARIGFIEVVETAECPHVELILY